MKSHSTQHVVDTGALFVFGGTCTQQHGAAVVHHSGTKGPRMQWRTIFRDYVGIPREIPLGGRIGGIYDPGNMSAFARGLLDEQPPLSREAIVSRLFDQAAQQGVLDTCWQQDLGDGLPKSSIPLHATNRQIIEMIANATD